MNETSSQYFRRMRVVHFALIMGKLIFLGFAIFFRSSNDAISDDQSLADLLLYFSIFSVFILPGIAFLVQKKRFEKIKKESNLINKMMLFGPTLVLTYTLIDLPTIISVVAYLLGTPYYVLIIGCISLMILASQAPTRKYVINKLQLNKDEIKQINDPDTIINRSAPQQTN